MGCPLEGLQKCIASLIRICCCFQLFKSLKKLKQLSNSFDYSLLSTGELVCMFKITHGLQEFPMESTFTHPTRKGLRGHAYKFHQQRCCTRRRQYAFSIRAVPFWNTLPDEIVNTSSVKSFKTLLDAHWQSLFPEILI